MSRLARDVRHAVRAFVRGRSVTVLAVLAFALGIGVTTAVFSIFSAVLLTPLPYPDSAELVAVYDTQPACATCPASVRKYHEWKARNQVFAAIAGSHPVSLVLTGHGDPVRVAGLVTTPSLVDVLGIPPAFGRWYTEAESQPGGPKVVVLSYPFWIGRMNRDAQVVGRTLTLDGQPYEILGVMPERVAFRNAELFVPLQRRLDPGDRAHFLATVARLKKGVPLERATSEMRALGPTLAREFGQNHGIDVRSLYEVTVGNIRTPLRVLLGAVFLVLLIACANVANLLLASGLARRRELAIRLALGAGRGDLARQLTAEALVLAIVGGAIGVLLASWGIRTFVTLAGNVLPRAATVEIDGRVVAFAAVLSLLVGIVCGLWPLARLRTRALASAVREGDTRTGSGAGRTFGNGLVVAEIALAYALLVGAGLLVKNLMLLEGRDAGIETARVVAFDVAPAGPRYADQARVAGFYRELLDRLQSTGGVQSAGATSHLPMYRFGNNGEMTIEGGNPWGPSDAPLVEFRWIAGDYFRTIGIKLLEGRLFNERDRQGTQQVVVVTQSMAAKFWPGKSAVGRRIASGSSNDWWEVIGVINDVRSFGLAATTPYEMYRTVEQQPSGSMTVVARTVADDPAQTIQAARQIVGSIDPALPVTAVQTMEAVVSASVRQPRLLSALTSLFGGLAGLLAMVGVYGVTAYNVRRQRREYGIRLALGANAAAVQRLVVSRGLVVSLCGVALGAAGALALTRTLQAMLNDVKPTDPVVFAVNGALVLLVSVAACYLPARSAGRVDPMVVLRDD
jgi:putative ABC transport system permease protein